MTADEFWKKVTESYEKYKNSDNASVEFFKSDLDALFEKWESEEHEYKF